MLGAIRLTLFGTAAAEVEIVVAGMTVRPHADGAGELEYVAPRRRLDRDHPGHKAEPVDLADHGVLGHADAAADLGGGNSLVPQKRQLIDALGRPGADIHVPHRIL